jgi:hypothetical protein
LVVPVKHAFPVPSHPVVELQVGAGRPVWLVAQDPPEAVPRVTVKLLKSSAFGGSIEHVAVAVAVTTVPPPAGHVLVLAATVGFGQLTPVTVAPQEQPHVGCTAVGS